MPIEKINGTGTDPRLNGVSNPAQTSAAAAANDPANAPATTPKRNADQATLSERARLLNKSHAALNDVAEVRAEKVEAAKKSLQNGTYQVDLKSLANRLLDLVK